MLYKYSKTWKVCAVAINWKSRRVVVTTVCGKNRGMTLHDKTCKYYCNPELTKRSTLPNGCRFNFGHLEHLTSDEKASVLLNSIIPFISVIMELIYVGVIRLFRVHLSTALTRVCSCQFMQMEKMFEQVLHMWRIYCTLKLHTTSQEKNTNGNYHTQVKYFFFSFHFCILNILHGL